MAVRVRVGIRLPVLQVGQKVSLVVVGTKAALLLLQRVDLITTHCEMLRSILKKLMSITTRKHRHTHLVQFRAYVAVDYFVLVWLTKHSNVIVMR